MEIILYEDEAVSGLYPVTLARPAFDIRMAAVTLLEAVKFVFPKAQIQAHTRALVHDVSIVPQFFVSKSDARGFLYLNARLAPSLTALQELAGILSRSSEECTVTANGVVVGCFTHTALSGGMPHMSNEAKKVSHELVWKLLAHPEEIIFFNRDAIGENLAIMTKKMRSKSRGVYLGANTSIAKQSVFDTTKGPIVIGDHVVVHPFVVLKGPLFIGESSIIKEFSVIEGGTTIGPVSRVGGEVGDAVIDGYSNKQHAGTLHHSYVGRWVNIGGGTSISDLKNTYSHVSVQGRDSGAQFLGAIIGDFSKTSINTSIFPGKVIGASAHVYSTVVEDVPSFASYVRAGTLYELPLRLAQKGQEAVAMRRGVLWNDMDAARMEKIFEMTASDREAKGVRKEKLSFT